MSVIDHFKDAKERVRYYLEQYPQARDSDAYLLAIYWAFELGEERKILGADGFLKRLSEGKIANPETIRRNRQLIQAECPSLCGSRKTKRLEEEKEVRNEINK